MKAITYLWSLQPQNVFWEAKNSRPCRKLLSDSSRSVSWGKSCSCTELLVDHFFLPGWFPCSYRQPRSAWVHFNAVTSRQEARPLTQQGGWRTVEPLRRRLRSRHWQRGDRRNGIDTLSGVKEKTVICNSTSYDESPTPERGNIFIGDGCSRHSEPGEWRRAASFKESDITGIRKAWEHRLIKWDFLLFFFKHWQITTYTCLTQTSGWMVCPKAAIFWKMTQQTTFVHDEVSSLLSDSYCLFFVFALKRIWVFQRK